MKKSLLLMSVLAASSVAQAQSSVTLSGTVDAAVERVTGSVTNRNQLTSGGNATSKLIFRGTEDLGGGMYANFWLESGFTSDTGAGQATILNNVGAAAAATGTQGLTFNRRSIVGLGGAWGEVHMGREWAPAYTTYTARYDPFALSVGIGQNYTASAGQVNTLRVSNAVSYYTPKFFGGLVGNVAHWFGEGASGTATSKDGTGDGFSVDYDAGPINSRVSVARTNLSTGNVITRNGAAAYDFGIVRVSGNLSRNQVGTLHDKGFLLGVYVPMGAGEIRGSYSQIKTNAVGNPEAKKVAIGYIYNLSKRTALYTTYAHISNSNGSALAIAGSTTGANRGSSGFDIGLRHNF